MRIREQVRFEGRDRLESGRNFMRGLFEKRIVDALLVPMEGPGHSVMPSLIKDPALLEKANPFAPVMSLNSARLVSMLTREDAGQALGAVLRPCEIRAVIELAKFNQAKLDKLVIVGVDCVGTLTVPEYDNALSLSADLISRYLAGAKQGNADSLEFRSACKICDQPAATNADIALGFIGVEDDTAFVVEAREDLAEKLQLKPREPVPAAREQALTRLVAKRIAARDAELGRFRSLVRSSGGLAAYLADCVECTNCMNACPICYCKECFFRTSNAEHTPQELFRSAERRGALAMPPDALLFQVTRLNHMATSCVGCGMCEAACPHRIPLTAMFRAVGQRVQKSFGYTPGAEVNDKPPFMSFKPDELLDIGEASH